MIKAYFFDWMDTLANTTVRFTVKERFGVKCHQELLIKNLENTDISEEHKREIAVILREATHWLYPDSRKVISELKSRYKLAIVSNTYDITAQKIRELFPEFLKNFDMITFSSEIGLRKPDPEIFTYTLNELNKISDIDICPGEIIMIGDKQDKDIIPAQSLGMKTMLVDRKKQTLQDLLNKK